MLKNLKINGKDIPVVVPLLVLGDVVDWVEKNLTKKDQTITKFIFNNTVYSLEDFQWKKLKIKKTDLIEINTESARELSFEVFETLFDLCVGLDKKAQKLAISFWKGPILSDLKDFKLFMDDLFLLLDLIHHVNGMLDYSHNDMAPLNGNSFLIQRIKSHLHAAFSEENWRLCSRLLVGRLEPLLNILVNECDFLKLRVVDAHSSFEEVSNSKFYFDAV